jgi:hypothetical protein
LRARLEPITASPTTPMFAFGVSVPSWDAMSPGYRLL